MLDKIRRAIVGKNFIVTKHANTAMDDDMLILDYVLEATQRGEVIEEYPKDFPFPSCLVYGRIEIGLDIHCVWAYDDAKKLAILITTYKPDENEWIDFKARRG